MVCMNHWSGSVGSHLYCSLYLCNKLILICCCLPNKMSLEEFSQPLLGLQLNSGWRVRWDQLVMLAPVTSQVPVLVAAPWALGVSLSSAPPDPAPVRKLTCKVLHNTCKKCGQFRTAETGHSQYKDVYCASVEAELVPTLLSPRGMDTGHFYFCK